MFNDSFPRSLSLGLPRRVHAGLHKDSLTSSTCPMSPSATETTCRKSFPTFESGKTTGIILWYLTQRIFFVFNRSVPPSEDTRVV